LERLWLTALESEIEFFWNPTYQNIANKNGTSQETNQVCEVAFFTIETSELNSGRDSAPVCFFSMGFSSIPCHTAAVQYRHRRSGSGEEFHLQSE
jgi:hypothetical protein